MGRPKKEISEKTVYELAKIHCTMPEIAAVCDCSIDTLERRFIELIRKGKEFGKSSLRRYQWKLVEDGNVAMTIFLGKQMLGQSDKVQQVQSDQFRAAVKEFGDILAKEQSDK